MKINSVSAGAGVVPNHVRIIDIDTTINHEINGIFPQDLVNYTEKSIQNIHTPSEYSSLDQKAEELLKTQHGDIKIVIDIEGRDSNGRLIGYFHIYDIVKEFGEMIGLAKRTSIEVNKTDTLRGRTVANIYGLTTADDGNNGEIY